MAKQIFVTNHPRTAVINDRNYDWIIKYNWYAVVQEGCYCGVATPVLTLDNFKVWLFLDDMVLARNGRINHPPFYELGEDCIPNCDYERIDFKPLQDRAEVPAYLSRNTRLN